MLTGSVDATIRVWGAAPDSPCYFDHLTTLIGHTGAVNCITTLGEDGIAVSGASDGTIRIWHITISHEGTRATLLQTLDLRPKAFVLAVAIYRPKNHDHVILAAGGTRNVVEIYATSSSCAASEYTHKATLTGHESWIRSLDFTTEGSFDTADAILASASQDKFVRLWRLRQLTDVAPSSFGGGCSAVTDIVTLSNKSYKFSIDQSKYAFVFEALLLGHEDWIYSAKWHTSSSGSFLLTASADNSLAIWKAESASGVWICSTRLGDLSAQKGSTTATGSIGGFWTGLWSSDGQSVVSLGRTGSWRLWRCSKEAAVWNQRSAISGHTGDVRALAWSMEGTYVLSTSADQTTRLHAPWKRAGNESWHEFARPQIHGYDLNCIAAVSDTQFVSGAEEKLLRVFDQPRPVAKLLNTLSTGKEPADESFPEVANIPVLGLSNKSVDATREQNHGSESIRSPSHIEDLVDSSTACEPASPPSEDLLSRHTLWPEHEKLYGHGFEVSALSCSNDGTCIATACKATSIEHAAIRIYRTKDWREINPALKSHALTVTCLRFSGDDKFILSVGRDRQWSVFARAEPNEARYYLSASDPKGHARMILGASWAPVEFGLVFATASRDKTIKLWRGESNAYSCRNTIAATSAVTDVSFHQRIRGQYYILAAGLDTGDVFIYSVLGSHLEVSASLRLDDL